MGLLWAPLLLLVVAVLETYLMYSLAARYADLRQKKLENKEEN